MTPHNNCIVFWLSVSFKGVFCSSYISVLVILNDGKICKDWISKLLCSKHCVCYWNNIKVCNWWYIPPQSWLDTTVFALYSYTLDVLLLTQENMQGPFKEHNIIRWQQEDGRMWWYYSQGALMFCDELCTEWGICEFCLLVSSYFWATTLQFLHPYAGTEKLPLSIAF